MFLINSEKRKFIFKILVFILIGSIPVLILVLGYIYNDPFKILFKSINSNDGIIIPNRDFVSTERYLTNKNKYNYNSFIFGSSRSLAFRPTYWKQKLKSNDQPYAFDASGESIFGIYRKIKFLDSIKSDLNNVIILLCRDGTFKTTHNKKEFLYVTHPYISGDSWIEYNYIFLKAYLTPVFLLKYYSYKIINEYKPFMKGVIDDNSLSTDSITNEIKMVKWDNEIYIDRDKYYSERGNIFYKRNGERVDSVKQVNDTIYCMLREIKQIFDNNKTNYKIVISPLYDQIKYCPDDMCMLKEIFGDKLYDFSGKNSITDSLTNYYELSHFRPHVGDSIINKIYNE